MKGRKTLILSLLAITLAVGTVIAGLSNIRRPTSQGTGARPCDAAWRAAPRSGDGGYL